MSNGLCCCGCEGRTKIAPRTHTARGWVKGQPQPYLRGHAAWKDHGPRWIADANGCWIWQRRANRQGYAIGSFVSRGGKSTGLAHRAIYEQQVGPIPEGMELDHRCFVTMCVNPAHMEPVTSEENLRRRRSTPQKAWDPELAKAYQMRTDGMSWRKIAAELGMTHGPLIGRVRDYCERKSLPYQ
ncbi:HNH endonuclease signature motif containing protein [Streptomyces sp. NPDC020298]|uniref:HNH endonuclease signature motif containing protein n=1 Tax=unclassified Streptomyces TaxID=2593676 RepID=UPI0033FF23DE